MLLPPSRRRRAVWSLGLLAAVGILCVSAFSEIVGADNNLGASVPTGGWVVFNVSKNGTTATVSIGQNSGGPGFDAASLFPSGWPGNFSDGGVSFAAVGPCPASGNPVPSSCTYNVSGSGTVNLYAGNVPPADQQPTSFSPPTTTTTAAPTTTTTTAAPQPPPDSTFTGPPTGVITGPGQFTFQSPNAPGVTYTWVLQLNGQKVDQQNGSSYTPQASIFNVPGEYTLTLVATDGLMHQSFHSVSFQVQGQPQPQPQQQAPPRAGPAPGQPVVSAPSVTKVSNVPQLVNFSTPKPGAVQPVTVIWLWKPDWFQNTGRPKTAGSPTAVKRASVSVDAKGSPSATPWLAGLAAFGIFGGAWLAVRRRRVRTSILD